jgi:hypothetical protein
MMQQALMKSAIEIPDQLEPEEDRIPTRDHEGLARRAWILQSALFMGIPIDDILPQSLTDNMELKRISQEFQIVMRELLGKGYHHDRSVGNFIKKLNGYAKLYCYSSKKVIRSDDIHTMLQVFSPSMTKELMASIANATRDMYRNTKLEMDRLSAAKKISLPYRHPSLLRGVDNTYPHGQGSYGQSNEWGYGKQSSVEFTNASATRSGKSLHPFLLVPMHIDALPSGSKALSCEFTHETMLFASDGSIMKNDHVSMTDAWARYMKPLTGNDELWEQSSSKNGDLSKRLFIQHPQKKITWFSALVTAGNSPLDQEKFTKIEIFLGKTKKIGEITYDSRSSAILSTAQAHLNSFLARYIASELAAYGFAAIMGLSVPQSCEVPPNGNPWLSFRISGRLSSTPSMAMGQAAFPENYIVFSRDKEDAYTTDTSRVLRWEEFDKEVRVIHANDGVLRIMHDSFNYHVDIMVLPKARGMKVTLFSDSFNYIDELRVQPQNKDSAEFIGKVALAQAMGIQDAPDYSEIECLVTHVPMNLSSKNGVRLRPAFEMGDILPSGDYAPLDSLPQSSISYHMNAASTVIYKNSNMSRIRGDLTGSLKLFESQTIDQSHFSEYATWQDVVASCQKQFSSNFFRAKKKKDREELFSESHIQFLIANIHTQLNAHETNQESITVVPEVKEKDDNTFCTSEFFPLLRTSLLKYGLSYDVYLIKRISHKSYHEAIFPQEKTFFNSLFSFMITCKNAYGQEICVYQPSYSVQAGNYPRYSSIGDILCGYLPDFMLWMCREGLRNHKNDQLSSAYFAQRSDGYPSLTKDKREDETLPFSPDASMIVFQKEMVRRWISYHFPSISRTSSGYHGSDLSILDHLILSVQMVDEPRGTDDYCPSSELDDEDMARLLRITMLLHDIGKSSVLDGGIGPHAINHERYSSALAAKLLPQFFLKRSECESIEKWIYHHSAFEYAVAGKYGNLEDASAHIAKLCGSVTDAAMLYHIYRCDLDSSSREPYDKTSKEESFSPEELLEKIESYLESSSFSPVATQKIHCQRTFDTVSKFWNNLAGLSANGEKAIRKDDLENYLGVSMYSISRQKFSIEYLLKAESMLPEIRKNPELSFARSLGMSYEGPTGSIVRCFQWVNVDSIQNIFLEGLMPYASIDGRSIYASVNEAAPLPVPLYNENFVALLVFDYHCGKMIKRHKLDELAKEFSQAKKATMGSPLFSLSICENDLVDNARIGLKLGYSASLDVHNDKKILCCFDPSRAALITALMVPMSTARKELSADFKGTPMEFLDRQHTGRFKKVSLPDLAYEDLRVRNNNIQWISDVQ